MSSAQAPASACSPHGEHRAAECHGRRPLFLTPSNPRNSVHVVHGQKARSEHAIIDTIMSFSNTTLLDVR
ncbi:hypothetical protein ACP4OV_024629 [Aristida adscensionis]